MKYLTKNRLQPSIDKYAYGKPILMKKTSGKVDESVKASNISNPITDKVLSIQQSIFELITSAFSYSCTNNLRELQFQQPKQTLNFLSAKLVVTDKS